MKRCNAIICGVFLTLTLTACGEKTKTEEWYISHPEELKKEVSKCNTKSIAEIIQDKHCQAIEKARIKAFNEQQRNAPSSNVIFK